MIVFTALAHWLNITVKPATKSLIALYAHIPYMVNKTQITLKTTSNVYL